MLTALEQSKLLVGGRPSADHDSSSHSASAELPSVDHDSNKLSSADFSAHQLCYHHSKALVDIHLIAMKLADDLGQEVN